MQNPRPEMEPAACYSSLSPLWGGSKEPPHQAGAPLPLRNTFLFLCSPVPTIRNTHSPTAPAVLPVVSCSPVGPFLDVYPGWRGLYPKPDAHMHPVFHGLQQTPHAPHPSHEELLVAAFPLFLVSSLAPLLWLTEKQVCMVPSRKFKFLSRFWTSGLFPRRRRFLCPSQPLCQFHRNEPLTLGLQVSEG